MTTLYLIRGCPGAGKSTLALILKKEGVVSAIFEADDYFINQYGYNFDAAKLGEAHRECQRKTEEILNYGLSVAVSNTSTTEKEVQVYQELAKRYNAKFVSIIVENRSETKSLHNVPEEKIKQMKERFSVKL